jgi:broad specificity phosphatase PhoE
MERALLVRHGESVFSARGLATGRVDVRCPLSERGKAQARALAEEVSGEDIDLCVTSELERTRQTAEPSLGDRFRGSCWPS